MNTVKSFWTVLNSEVKDREVNSEEMIIEFEFKNPLANFLQGNREVKGGRLIPA